MTPTLNFNSPTSVNGLYILDVYYAFSRRKSPSIVLTVRTPSPWFGEGGLSIFIKYVIETRIPSLEVTNKTSLDIPPMSYL